MKTTAWTLLLLVLSGALFLTYTTMQGLAEGSIFILPDGTVSPAAPIQCDADTYTLIGNITESIVVQKDNIIIDGNGYSVLGDGTGRGFDLFNRKNVTVENVYIAQFNYGIYLSQSRSNKIISNTITKCVYGVISQQSPNNLLSNNIVANNSWDGIFITYSDGSVLNGNIVANHSKWGLYLGSSNGMTLRNNGIIGNRWNFGVSDKYIHDIDDSNTVDGKPVIYFMNQHDKQVPADAGYVALINSTNITVRNLNLTNNGQGVVLVDSKNCLVEGSTIRGMGYYAIQLINSDDNIIQGNNITDNKPPYFGVGIAVQRQSTGNTVSNNQIQFNDNGILFYDSGSNRVYHNNFVGNTVHASNDGAVNIWDDGYPSGGNFWSGYSEEDANGDGIGDQPYRIDKENSDRYPLMNMVKVKTDFTFTPWNQLLLLIVGVAAIIIVAILAYFMKSVRVNRKKEREEFVSVNVVKKIKPRKIYEKTQKVRLTFNHQFIILKTLIC